MRWKTTLVLVVAFAALLVYYLLQERGSKTTEEAQADAKRVFRFREKDVGSLRIVRPGGSVRVERTDDQKWRMTEPVAGRADRWAADAAAGALADLEQARTVQNDRGIKGFDEMGLSKPRARVEFTLGGGQKSPPEVKGTTKAATPLSVEFGNEVPATNSVFLKVSGREDVLLVQASSASPFLKPIDDYRDHALLDTTILDIAEAEVLRSSGNLRFKRRDEEWWIQEPVEDIAAGDTVQGLLSAVIGLRAEKFVDGSGSSLEPVLDTVRLFDRKGTEIATVKIGSAVSGETGRCYARTDSPSGPGPLVIVPSGGLDSLAKPAKEFRSRKALPFRSWEAAGLNLVSSEGTLSFVKKEGTWSATSPPALKNVDAAAIEATLQALADIEVRSYDAANGASLSALGLDPPRTRLEVPLEPAGGKVKTLVLGAPAGAPNAVYARALGRPSVFTVDSSILDRIKGGVSLYAEKAKAPEGTEQKTPGKEPSSP